MNKCGRCGKELDGYPALSRVDHLTAICDPCGTEEALRDYYGISLTLPVSPAAENGEELTEFDLILSENPDDHDEDAAKAFYDNQPGYWDDNKDEFWDQFEDSYQGAYRSDEDFAMELADAIGSIDHNAAWPYTCIDWGRAARELMYDYFESGGYYFRNI